MVNRKNTRIRRFIRIILMYNTSMVSFDGGLRAKSMTSQRNRQIQDGGYSLLW